jgi:MYXO-CTERM domain-containing protein
VRDLPANANASMDTQVYLYQTWARPNFVDGALAATTDPQTGAVTRSTTPATTFFPDLETMTAELRGNLQSFATAAGADGTGGFAGVAPVGQAFLRAVQDGAATRNPYAADALTDGRIDLWFDDGFHASKYGSYLSALTLFGTLTGQNPAQFGAGELAAAELGIRAQDALALQRVAALELGFTPPVPEPGTAALGLLGLAVIALRRRQASVGR